MLLQAFASCMRPPYAQDVASRHLQLHLQFSTSANFLLTHYPLFKRSGSLMKHLSNAGGQRAAVTSAGDRGRVLWGSGREVRRDCGCSGGLSKRVEDEESTIADIKKAAASKLSKFKVCFQISSHSASEVLLRVTGV